MDIRIFIYDDNTSRTNSLKTLIEESPGLEVAGNASNCSDIINDIEQTYPDIILMDINMPECDGITGLIQIKKMYPHIKVLMQTVFEDSDKIFKCIRNGASGYILKRDSAQNLIKAIYDVYNGGAVMTPDIAQKVIEFFRPSKDLSPLSARENEVLSLLASGLSYKMIASELNISFNTVCTHTKRMYEKLQIDSAGEAIAYYYKNIGI
ncbi:response regulator [Haoranjiania flava]|uniref:Response regulator transcription factor n=1 Tax=Haoranjiania flava TaxID=1856322 RepID=A0AAE3INE0_9BACT|nr:response regulator transcription factor [Haoranjiania flava]MCU7694176.1 response regulator transcription factor [Haoranjiania flava]